MLRSFTRTISTVDVDTPREFGEESHVVWTVSSVVFGIGRDVILQIGRGGDDPTRVLLGRDPRCLANVVGWAQWLGPSCRRAAAPRAPETD